MAILCAFLVLSLFATTSLTDRYDSSIDSTKHSNRASKNVRCAFKAAKNLTEDVQDSIFKFYGEHLKVRQELESKLVKLGRVVSPSDGKSDLSQNRDYNADFLIHKMELAQLPFDMSTQHLSAKLTLSDNVLMNYLPGMDVKGELGKQFKNACRKVMDTAICDPNSKYRRADGQCNNLDNPKWGSAITCQPRLLKPNYVGVSGFRVSVNGDPLPGAREVSLKVHYHYNRPTKYMNHLYMFFGQLVDHDIAFTPLSTTGDNQAIKCCPPQDETHPQCAPILIPKGDPFYSQYNITCLNFVRSAICPTCKFGKKQLINQKTSTIDASFVYGNSENKTRSLRTNDGTGRLRIQKSAYGDLLPESSDPQNDQCSLPKTNDICFQAGDQRVNQHTMLASLQTIFVREHNRVAIILGNINPQWDGERIFQETRRIIGAQMQCITYKEYLPITLGSDRMSYFKLRTGRSTEYDPKEDPTTLLEFTTAAFRFGHSYINSIVARRPLNSTNQPRYLRNEFFQPFALYKGDAGPLLAGSTFSPAQQKDSHMVPDVRNYLFKKRGAPTGLDLAAANIQRGRDHGMPTYVDTVRYCSDGQIRIRNFNDLVRYELMEPEQADVLRNTYRFVKDIDLWTGIIAERYKQDAAVGVTGACIIGLQFKKFKYGDRFYFEHRNQAGSFTYEQLQEIRQTSLSQIICLNTEVRRLPMNAMLFNSRDNTYIQCRYVRGIDLSYWQE